MPCLYSASAGSECTPVSRVGSDQSPPFASSRRWNGLPVSEDFACRILSLPLANDLAQESRGVDRRRRLRAPLAVPGPGSHSTKSDEQHSHVQTREPKRF